MLRCGAGDEVAKYLLTSVPLIATVAGQVSLGSLLTNISSGVGVATTIRALATTDMIAALENIVRSFLYLVSWIKILRNR